MSSLPSTPTSPNSPSRTDGTDVRSVRRRLRAFRVFAYLTGVLLLLLVASMVLKYGYGRHELTWAAYLHGWMYLSYLVTVVLLGTAVRWRLGRMVLVALAGTVPLMSFVVERSVSREVRKIVGGRWGSVVNYPSEQLTSAPPADVAREEVTSGQ